MKLLREIHPDFLYHLNFKDQGLVDLYMDLRNYILKLYPDSYELLYHTHALTSLYSVSPKMGDAFCMIPIYTNHLNLGFNKGTMLDDPDHMLQGTGKFIRHVPIKNKDTYKSTSLQRLIQASIEYSLNDTDATIVKPGITISKIKKKH